MKLKTLCVLLLQICALMHVSEGQVKRSADVIHGHIEDQHEILQSIRSSVQRNTAGLKRTITDLHKQQQLLQDLLQTCRRNSIPNFVPTTTPPPPPTTTTTTTEAPKSCPTDTMELSSGDLCMHASNFRLNFDDAQKYCMWRRGLLAFGEDHMQEVVKNLKVLYGAHGTRTRWPFWSSGFKNHDGNWVWMDWSINQPEVLSVENNGETRYVIVTKGPNGDVFRFKYEDYVSGDVIQDSFWASGEPNDLKGLSGSCVLLDGYQEYSVISYDCSQKRRFVCLLPKE